uniref:FAD-binding PCMH-type domain-containing protein n=1 Tax=Macrostomum lignano TaxID=282301 RepID=A0A1I8JMI5_9PLAT
CVTPLYSAAGWHIVTIEGIGGRSQSAGYHPIQASLADGFGSQCGYCSPGFVMLSTFSTGNICRCTGYRPILDSMKSFACDAGKAGGCLEVEARSRARLLPKPSWQSANLRRGGHRSRGWKGQKFYNPGTLKELLTLLGRLRNDNYRFAIFARVANDNKQAGRAYLGQFSRHLQQVANQAVRRNGCWAGNLMLKLAHPEFPSDLFVLMAASGAIDMRGRVVTSALLPLSGGVGQRFGSFKITPRALNAHAYLNAAFNVSVDSANGYTVTDRPRICLRRRTARNHAVKTENYLQNKSLIDQETVNGAIKVLESELNPAEEATWSSPQHRRSLASNLLYKFILGVASAALPARTAAELKFSCVESTEQDFEQEPSEFAVGAARASLPKPRPEDRLLERLSTSTMLLVGAMSCLARSYSPRRLRPKLKGFGTEEAEQVPGYDRLITAKDLEEVRYAGQPLAIVLAKSQRAADRAAALVTVDTLNRLREPITSVAEAVAKASRCHGAPVETVGSEDVAKELDSAFFMESLTAAADAIGEEGLLISAAAPVGGRPGHDPSPRAPPSGNELRVVDTPNRRRVRWQADHVGSDRLRHLCRADIAQQPVRMY